MLGKTIQIFLPDGNPKGIKKATITTDKIEIIQIPRTMVSENLKMIDFKGVYILVDNLRAIKPEIYVGKGNVSVRAASHNKNKDFWTTIFAIRLKDENGFNDAHNSYLEYYFINKAHEVNQSVMNENKQIPECPNLPEEHISELQYYIQTIETLLATLGLKSFQPMENPNIKKKDILICSDKYGNYGEGEYTEEGFLLYKGAKCKVELHKGTKSLPIRDHMIENGLLKQEKDHYILQEKQIISSVSTAASIILGRRTNGWLEWKNRDGVTLDELERK